MAEVYSGKAGPKSSMSWVLLAVIAAIVLAIIIAIAR
jgi:hypothetical protein